MPKARKVVRRRKRTSAPPVLTESDAAQARLWQLLDKLVELFRDVVAGIQDPKRATAAATVARAAAALLNALEPRRRVELLFRTPEWKQLEQALAEALAPYPKARDAVSAALRRIAREGEA